MKVSSYSKEKGIDTLIKTIPYILDKNRNTAFLLILPGNSKMETYIELEEKLKRLISKYKNRIKLISKPVSQKTLSKFYNMADLYIQPSLYEGMPLTILEAMACGKSIVASDCGGIAEIVFNGYNGLLVEPGEHEDLSRNIFKILNNPEFKRKMEKNSIKFIQKHNWGLIGKQTLDLYEKILVSKIWNK